MSRQFKSLARLGELEVEILELLWRSAESDVGTAHAAIGKARGITANTVGSALERLHRKGLARREKVSHAYRYYPALSREEFAARRAVEAAGGVRALSAAGVLSAFIDLVADVDARTLDRLESLIAEKRQRSRKA